MSRKRHKLSLYGLAFIVNQKWKKQDLQAGESWWLTCTVNQLTDFYMRATLGLNGFKPGSRLDWKIETF